VLSNAAPEEMVCQVDEFPRRFDDEIWRRLQRGRSPTSSRNVVWAKRGRNGKSWHVKSDLEIQTGKERPDLTSTYLWNLQAVWALRV